MLENIIKTYLFESRRFTATVQKTRPESEFNKALDAGAIYAFEVVYKIKLGKDPLPSEKDVMNTLDDIISADGVVGASSKFAVASNKYVLGTDLKDVERRMKWNVWIVPSVKKVKSTTVTSDPNQKTPVPGKDLQPVEIDEVPVVASRYTIGASTLVQFKQLNAAEQAKYKDINEGQPFTAASNKPAAVIDQPEEKEIINKPAVEKGVPIQNLFAPPKADPTASTTETPKKPTYPYQQLDGNVLETMSDSDPYIYTYMDNAWYTMNKKAWESGTNPKPILIKNAEAIAKLNKEFAKTAVVQTATPVVSYKPNEQVRLKFDKNKAVYLKWFKNGKFESPKYKDKNGNLVDGAFYYTNTGDDNATFKSLATTDPNYARILLAADGKLWFVRLQDIKPAK